VAVGEQKLLAVRAPVDTNAAWLILLGSGSVILYTHGNSTHERHKQLNAPSQRRTIQLIGMTFFKGPMIGANYETAQMIPPMTVA
jgi:hypothetical protein